MPIPYRFYDDNVPTTVQGQYNSTTPTLTDKQSKPLQLDSAGNLMVNLAVGGQGGGGGPATIADGADVTQGTIADAAVTSDVNGTLSAKLRGLVKIFADAWDSANHRIKVDGSGVTQPISGTVSVTNFTSPLPVTGTFFQATQPVSGTFFQATQPISGTVTTTPPANASTNVAQVGGGTVSLGAKTSANSIPVVLASDEAALPVTGTFFQATQPVSGTVSVTNFANPLPVIGTFFQATQPVSGTVTANAGTNLNTSLLALEAGGNLASIKADVDKIPSQGQALSAASMPVVLPATQITTLTPPTSVGVNNFPATQPVSGTFFQTTQPISAASLPLATNAAQETGGNLASLVLQTRNDAQIIDILNAILGQLKLLNLNLASAMPSAHVDSDTWVMDTLPTLQ